MRNAYPFSQGTIPVPNDLPGVGAVNIGDLWSDTSGASPVFKVCTSLNPVVFTAISAGSIVFADAETPSGTINGINTTFTLAFAPNPGASLLLFLNGLLQTGGGVDYTLSSSTITFVTAPSTGDSLIAFYRH